MTARELKARLKSSGLPTTGNKNALATRLASHTLKDGKDAVSTNQPPPLDVERKIDESTALQMKEMELKKLHLELELMEAKQGQIITTGNTPTNELTETLKIMKTSLERQSLPRPVEPRIFDGSPLRYRDWRMAFNTHIASKSILMTRSYSICRDTFQTRPYRQ